ncbi:aromatase/cyclase [Streptomyces sp. NPDC051576]|uniref:aromatase/cyclase n=1 Tax=Streptomyces sp. NPDC051576 TaxID=3155803 RepID=UPI0034439C2D
MTAESRVEVEHEIGVNVAADEVYRLIAEVENWPLLFPPTIHVEQSALGPGEERIRIWAAAGGQPRTWTSRRRLAPEERRIDFRQEISAHPVAEMGGAWIIEPLSAHGSRVRLLHDYRAVDDDADSLAWIAKAVDENSTAELAALKENAERATSGADLTFSFEDSVQVEGAAKDAYEFVYDAARWPVRLPHVGEVLLTEDAPGLQTLRMETRTRDDAVHTTESFRVCLPTRHIVYKQTVLPALMSLHTGHWRFDEKPDGRVTVTSRHTVVVNEDNIAPILGADAGVTEARDHIQRALSANSQATLRHTKAYAEAQR